VCVSVVSLQTLRRQVQHARDLQAKADAGYVQELQLQRFVGKGAFGTVYAGTWQGSPVAIKVGITNSSLGRCARSCGAGRQRTYLI